MTIKHHHEHKPQKRFQVDKRIGCVAVVDTKHPEYPREKYPVFNKETPWVVRYWNGRQYGVEAWTHWTISDKCVASAINLAARRNNKLIDKGIPYQGK